MATRTNTTVNTIPKERSEPILISLNPFNSDKAFRSGWFEIFLEGFYRPVLAVGTGYHNNKKCVIGPWPQTQSVHKVHRWSQAKPHPSGLRPGVTKPYPFQPSASQLARRGEKAQISGPTLFARSKNLTTILVFDLVPVALYSRILLFRTV
ncbi:MAG: hypothetical protein IIC64_05615 [SAR324 cluster bacterium]|nr:hypothetical protein [SAR324 cluster bacterium]